MIGMLRRRLMSDMAKAKNIATGTVTINQNYSQELTIPAFGFNPDHVAVFTESGGTGANIVTSIFDGHVNYIRMRTVSGSGATFYERYTMNIENAVSENGVKYTIPNLASWFIGTYRYVAWQE